MTAEQFPSVSVIIVSHNEMEHLDDCLRSLIRQDYPGSYEVILVDNASTDGTSAHIQAHFPEVRLIQSAENLGFAIGNNLGAKHSTGEILAFLNADTRPEPDWLLELVRPLIASHAVGLTTSKVVLMDRPETINTCGNELSLTGITTCRRAGEPANSVLSNEEVGAACGGALAISADLFRELGEFDPLIWPYMEDTDLSWRAQLAGHCCLLAARSVVAHDYTFKLPPHKIRAIERNRYLMLAKNLSTKSLLALTPHFLISELLTWGWAMLKGPRYVWAKVLAIVWMLTHIPTVARAHRQTQRLRRIPDEALLREFSALPPIELIAAGLLGTVSAVLLRPVALVTRAVALRLIASGHREAGMIDWAAESQLAGARELAAGDARKGSL